MDWAEVTGATRGEAAPPEGGRILGLTPLAAAMVLVGAVTVARVAVVFVTPLELYPDEAQYWLWSQRLAFGYFSKPPMIAWAVRATTALGGNDEAWVRLSAPLLHGGAALALSRAASRFYRPITGFWTATLYLLMPGVALSSVVIATDAPLLFFLGLALWALGGLWTTPAGERGWRAAGAFGAAMGLAALSKYAAFYMVAGLLAHAALDGQGRRRLWSPSRVAIAAAALLLVFAPNVVWNATHHFQTLAHTAADADLREGEAAAHGPGIDPRGPLGFLLSQFGVFGPAPFAILLGVAALTVVRRRSASPPDGLMLALTVPALVVVTLEAALARANANWAAAAYPSGAILAAAVLLRAKRRGWLRATVAVQGAAAVVVATAVVLPGLADRAHLSNSFKSARGWRAAAAIARAHYDCARRVGPVDALAVDDRFLFNALAYYGRAWPSETSAALRMWVHEARPRNQAEAEHPLVAGRRTAFVSSTWPRESQADFARVEDVHRAAAPVDGARVRPFLLYVGEDFRPRRRTVSRPTPP